MKSSAPTSGAGKQQLPWGLGASAGNMNGRRKGTGTMLDFGFYNMDCMDGMKEFPDGFFDLAVVDPPYGISITGTDVRGGADRRRKTIW